MYVGLGQFSSAILEYESILQRYPDDPDVLAALGEIESKAGSLPGQTAGLEGQTEVSRLKPSPGKTKAADARPAPTDLDDGQSALHKLFVDGKVITKAQFDQCWGTPVYVAKPTQAVEPFVQTLADKGFVPLEKSLRLISDRARVGYFQLDKYDIDLDLARSFPLEISRRWCLLPFDRMSKSILVATCNPFNRQAAAEVESFLKLRLLWFLTSPQDLMKTLRKVYR